jgi:hypothetical protein
MEAGHARPALLINEFCRDLLWQIGQENWESASITPLFVYAISRSYNKIVDLFGLNPCPLNDLSEELGQEFFRSYFMKPVSRRIIGSGSGLGSS